MHEQTELEHGLKKEAERLSSENGGAPVVILVGGQDTGPPRTQVASTCQRLREFLGVLEAGKHIVAQRHLRR